MPFDRSRADRLRRRADDAIDIVDTVYSRLTAIAGA
jgi:hypothetical protein